MSQVTLYLDPETDALLTQSAARSGLSKSSWVARLIRQHARDDWPPECLELAGAFPDFPLRAGDTGAALPPDSPRLPF